MPRPAGMSGPALARLTTASALLAALFAGAASPSASANGPGGAQSESTTPAPAPAGGSPTATSKRAPRVKRVTCRTACAGPAAARPGGVLDLRGTRIKRVEQVVFLGAAGDADDVTVLAQRVTKKRVLVEVPRFAASGPLSVVDGNGEQSAPSKTALTVGAPPASGSPAVDVEVQAPRVFFDGVRKAAVTFALRAAEPAAVDIQLVRASDGAVVASFPQGVVAPDEVKRVAWDGTAGGEPAPPGRYEFRATANASSGSGAQAATVAPGGLDTFELLDHQFPVRGAHDYGEHAASFGGGRGHQGHDVFATCGTPLVAARGGRVKFKQFHGAAGHYIVVDGEKTGVDYAYMHLREAALVDEGDRVRTGQLIGYVGDTGRASGCHLHFEMWSAPGWYDGGSPFDPLPLLRAWDRTS